MTSLRSLIVLSLICFVATVVRADDSKGTDAASKGTTAVSKVTTVAAKATTVAPIATIAPAKTTTAEAPKATTVAPKATSAPAKATTAAVARATTVAPKAAADPQELTMSKLAGDIILEVSDVDKFSGDKAAAVMVQEALATCVGVPVSDVRVLSIEVVKRVPAQSSARRLEAGSVKVRYEILDKSNAILPANVAISGSALTYEGNLALQKAQVPVTITQSSLSTPTKTPVAQLPQLPAATPAQENPCAVPATSAATTAGASPVSKVAAGSFDIANLGKMGADDLSKLVSNITKMVKSTETKVENLKPWQKKAGIAAVSMAGAAALAGSIAGIVESQAAPKASAKMTHGKDASKPRVVIVKVPVEVPVQPQTVPMLYDANSPAGAAVTKGSVVMNVVTFLFVGCVFIGASGFVYYKVGQRKRASQVHIFEQLPADEAV